MGEVLTPTCPRCGAPPLLVFAGGRQAFCPTGDCQVFTWNQHESAATFEANAQPVRLIDGE